MGWPLLFALIPPWRRAPSSREPLAPLWRLLRWLCTTKGWAWGVPAMLMVLWLDSASAPPAMAAATARHQAYSCAGDPLTALLVKGPMDEPSIPDPSTAPVPIGGSVVLQWRGLSLQLPRTNNAGPASFSDGKWWWSLADPDHPSFRQRNPFGNIEDFSCERVD
ncbi:MAG: hypothetical protein ACKO45_00760 [Cyanobium sp.]